MKTNHVRAKLKRGEPSVGTWLTLPDTMAARLMAQVGFDWLTVELEHSPTNFETAANSFAIIAATGPVPLARVPFNTVENIKRVLDTGAYGIVVPMVNSRAEAEAAVAADDILRLPGIDVIFIGPNDLHNSMGKPPAFESEHKEYVDAVKHILKTARKYGVAPGIHVVDAAAARRRLAEGFQFIAVASEAGMMLAKAAETAQALGLTPGKGVAK